MEIDEGRVSVLRGIPGVRRVTQGDFLDMQPTPRYDRVVMNPPFAAGNLDIDHVLHAYEFLKPGGRLIAIMSASVEFNDSVKARSFREMVKRQGGHFNDNPARSFSSVGTNVNTVTLEWRK